MITAQDVNKLRQMTGAGMMDCKKALTETNGDFEAAIDFLRKKGAKIAANRADRESSEGVAIARTNGDNTIGMAFTLNCETDFVAKNADFIALANKMADIAMNHQPADRDAFLALAFDGITIGEKLIEQTGVIGEKIEISKYALIKGALVAPYVHGANRMGVLVQLNKSVEGAFEAAKDVAMQVAAMNPLAVDENSVSAETIAREKNIIIDTMKADPKMADKPSEMLDKIAGGKLSAFFKENTLLNQQFVKDNSKTVSQYLKEFDKDLTVLSFERITLGK